MNVSILSQLFYHTETELLAKGFFFGIAEGPMVQPLSSPAGPQDQPQRQTFAFDMNMWTNDFTAFNNWVNLNGPASVDPQRP
jgi:hypothetical protein